jgi:hypothetical protein
MYQRTTAKLLYRATDEEMLHLAEALRDITDAISTLMDTTDNIRATMDPIIARRFGGRVPDVSAPVDELAARRAHRAGGAL